MGLPAKFRGSLYFDYLAEYVYGGFDEGLLPFCLLRFPSGSQFEIGQNSRKAFRFPYLVRKTIRVAPEKKEIT
jgi:hypothetical protein